jgi:hypothetical protein
LSRFGHEPRADRLAFDKRHQSLQHPGRRLSQGFRGLETHPIGAGIVAIPLNSGVNTITGEDPASEVSGLGVAHDLTRVADRLQMPGLPSSMLVCCPAAVRSQVNDEPPKVYRVGESWYEVPGSHHKVSENASDREPASLLAVIVVDSSDKPLTTPDKK